MKNSSRDQTLKQVAQSGCGQETFNTQFDRVLGNLLHLTLLEQWGWTR